jgi:hypothetical protein
LATILLHDAAEILEVVLDRDSAMREMQVLWLLLRRRRRRRRRLLRRQRRRRWRRWRGHQLLEGLLLRLLSRRGRLLLLLRLRRLWLLWLRPHHDNHSFAIVKAHAPLARDVLQYQQSGAQ